MTSAKATKQIHQPIPKDQELSLLKMPVRCHGKGEASRRCWIRVVSLKVDRPSMALVLPDVRLTKTFVIARMVQKPHLTQDLLALFNLQPLAATVARVDAEGNKINKMRKSYEGQVKTFGLSGRNRAIKHEPGKLPGLKELTTWPEEEWHNQKVVGKEVHKGLASTTLAKLERAMQMQPGLLPNNNEWEDLLGHEKAKPIITITEQNSRKHSNIMEASVVKPNGLTNGTRTGAGKPASEVPRPKRTNKKRRYDEHSFEGYGEGFVDDEGDIMLGGGYSSGDGSRKSGTSKKRRKVRS